ncbi:aminodeoxychorismate synthase component I [Arthrobacter sp.]|uniref:aminodeoxychorismate synthase component I n=1 Tax=Arthrobacter sp. TaxID=1667 RepID=UPI0033980CD4
MPARPVLIAVDGLSGSGKTTLAVELAALLRVHRTVSLFHLEDIYPGWHGLAGGQRRYLETVLRPLADGETARWTAWDWNKDDDGASRTTEPADVVLLEGVGAAHAAARGLLDAVVWLHAPSVDRRIRALSRDGATYEPFWDIWAAQEEAWLAGDDVAAAADVVVESGPAGSAPEQVLAALASLPALEHALAPERAAREGVRLLAERVDAYPDAESTYRRLYSGSVRSVWLDSSNVHEAADRNRVSIMADDGGSFGQWAEHRSGTTLVGQHNTTARISGGFFRWLDSVWGHRPATASEDAPGGFALGWLGYLGYELKRETGGKDTGAPVQDRLQDNRTAPDAALLFAGRAVLLDHVRQCTWLLALAGPSHTGEAAEWIAGTAAVIGTLPKASGPPRGQARPPAGLVFQPRDSREAYLAKILEAQAEIGEGNTYEVCLTTQLHATAAEPLDPLDTYLALRRRNPAPFASLLRFGTLTVASTSPERFLSIAADGGLRAEPIKGTRRRLADPDADAAVVQELAGSVKDRAENIMIVDLLRNDLSHFAIPGSLQVSRLCAIESYATVHQMVSTIDAQLLPGAVRAEAVAAAFPAGSMTGAPKISTMDILDRLETGPRGVYSGAVGYFSLDGAADLSVVIRTLVMDGNRLSLGVGGAITADSVPDDEWDEVRTKAFGVLSALGAVFPD